MLNKAQLTASRHINGPLMILAGAGSGKTTVMVHRIANMIQSGIDPSSIVAITFTNKAANELRERVGKQIGDTKLDSLHISTFHSFCTTILRENSDLLGLGLTNSFGIESSSGVKQTIKEVVEQFIFENEEDRLLFQPHFAAKLISLLKNELFYPKFLTPGLEMSTFLDQERIRNILKVDINPPVYLSKPQIVILQQLFVAYQKKILLKNRIDVDDLLFFPIRLFLMYPNVLEEYQERYRYFIVDEYQDTNKAQYGLLKILASKYRNIAVVGDDSQSIFGFRGSDMRNILEFAKDYPETFEVKLEENYRSTQTILSAANQIISKNQIQTQKHLFTSNEKGEKVRVISLENTVDEVQFVAKEILKLQQQYGYQFRDFAVFYRHNAESAHFESLFPNFNIPYRVSSDSSFFERTEIRDLLSYLQFLNNPTNKFAFERIINTPKRGIGKTSVEKIIAAAQGGNILDIAEHPDGIDRLNKNTLQGLKDFSGQIHELMDIKNTSSVDQLIDSILSITNYKSTYADLEKYVKKEKDDYIAKLISLSEELQYPSLDSFLQQVTKIDVDAQLQLQDDYDRVNLTTVHSAKGLEFPVVFIIGMKEQGFPSAYAFSQSDIEEERRLCHVGFTRAEKLLYASYPRTMRVQKDKQSTPEIVDTVRSRFLNEFDEDLKEEIRM